LLYTGRMAQLTPSRAALHQLLDQLPDDHMPAAFVALTQVQQDALRSTLASIPGLRLPTHWPPQFPDVEPMPYEGEPPSEQLIRERR
jgi:hypothetical protein